MVHERLNLSQMKFEKRPEKIKDLGFKKDFLYIRTSDVIYCLNRQEISHLKAQGNYTEIFTVCGKKILSSKTLKYFQNILSSPFFIRVHQSFLVNIRQVSQIQLGGGQCTIKMLAGCEMPISRSRQSHILSLLQN